VDLASVPVAPSLRDGATSLGVDALEVALGGGEDYELLATMPPGAVDGARERLRATYAVPLTVIGRIVAGAGVVGVADGTSEPLPVRGWDHFA
jgi:thiamine-monophosphate kinase